MAATDRRTICGLCGQRARYIGSHVISVHTAYHTTREHITAMLQAERAARLQARP